ncbi:unnamed protein product [Prunus armeniaca]
MSERASEKSLNNRSDFCNFRPAPVVPAAKVSRYGKREVARFFWDRYHPKRWWPKKPPDE